MNHKIFFATALLFLTASIALVGCLESNYSENNQTQQTISPQPTASPTATPTPFATEKELPPSLPE